MQYDKPDQTQLNGEYAQLIRYAVAALCRRGPTPIEQGKANPWACGITHALGMVNFLFDKSQTLYISPSDLYKGFVVAHNTGAAKSKLVRDLLGMFEFEPNWSLRVAA
jgi:hypothetical protein